MPDLPHLRLRPLIAAVEALGFHDPIVHLLYVFTADGQTRDQVFVVESEVDCLVERVVQSLWVFQIVPSFDHFAEQLAFRLEQAVDDLRDHLVN